MAQWRPQPDGSLTNSSSTTASWAIALVWLSCSLSSLISTKYIIGNGYPYPLHLLQIHLTIVVVFGSCKFLVGTFKDISSTVDTARNLFSYKDASRSRHAELFHFTWFSLSTSGALIAGYQAVRYVGTFAAAVAFLFCISIIPCIYINAHERRAALSKYILFLLGGALLLFLLDTKFDPIGIGCVALSASFATLAKTGPNLFFTKWRRPDQKDVERASWRLPSCVIGLALTTLSCWKWENPMYSPLSWDSAKWTIVVNVCSSVVALQLGLSPFGLLNVEQDSIDVEELEQSPSFTILLVWPGIVLASAASHFFHLSHLLNFWQCLGFFVMLECTIAIQKQCQSYLRLDQIERCEASSTILNNGQTSDEIFERVTGQTDEELGGSISGRESLVMPSRISFLLRLALMVGLWTSLSIAQRWNRSSHADIQGYHVASSRNSTSSFDFVVSRYDEPVPEFTAQLNQLITLPVFSDLRLRVIVYDKSNSSNHEMPREISSHLEKNAEVQVQHRPNIGREAETYLYHMLSNWDSLATHTIFMQAHMHFFQASKERIQQYFVPETGFLPLSPLETCNSCDSCSDHSTWSENSQMLERILNDGYGGKICDGLLLTYRGQFIASASRIRAHGQEHFESLHGELQRSDSYVHSAAYAHHPWLPGKKDEMSNPLFGYTLERMWGAVLQCSEPRIAQDCPSLSSGFLRKLASWTSVNVEDCQCLDIP